MTGPRDWDKELAEIDKIMAKSPAPPPAQPGAAPVPAQRLAAAPAQASSPVVSRRARFGIWMQVFLGAALGVVMTQWPYANQCGMGLFLYLGAAGLVGLTGLWSSLGSWRNRMGLAHTLSLLVLLWSLFLIAAVVLPRIGYTRVEAAWFC